MVPQADQLWMVCFLHRTARPRCKICAQICARPQFLPVPKVRKRVKCLILFGERAGTRTRDLLIKSQWVTKFPLKFDPKPAQSRTGR
jgi:hypothetical protein